MRVVTYNIRSCLGRDGQYDAERILRVIKATDGDIIVLQEVTSFRHAGTMVPDWFATCLGFHLILGSTLARAETAYGNVLLSRYPVTRQKLHDLSVPGREPRGAIEVRLLDGSRTIRVVGTHLGLSAAERGQQISRLCQILDEGHEGDVTVLAGDVNEWRRDQRSLRLLHERLGRPPAPRSFPASLPLWPLDRVWVRPAELLQSLAPLHTPESRRASDHLPVVAEIGDL